MRCSVQFVAFAALLTLGGCGDPANCVRGDLSLLVDPQALSFPATCPGQTSSLALTATNLGPCGAIAFDAAELENLGGEFALSFTTSTLEPGESAVIAEVTFTPSGTSGASEGSVVIHHDVAEQMFRLHVPVSAPAVPAAGLNADPSLLDFGAVPPGEFRDLTVVLTNPGCEPLTVRELFLDLEGDPGFSVESLALGEDVSFPTTLSRGDSVGVALRFQPSRCGESHHTLTVAGKLHGVETTWSFELTGTTGPCPALVVTPGVGEFMSVLPTQAAAIEFTLSNEGDSDVVIPFDGIYLETQPDPGLTLVLPPEHEMTLAPGDSYVQAVSWLPGRYLDGTVPLGWLHIVSNDPFGGPLRIPLSGSTRGPSLVVVPDYVDLWVANRDTPTQRLVTLMNTSADPLTISSVAVVDLPRTEYGDEFQLSLQGGTMGTNVGPIQLAGNESTYLTLQFNCLGPLARMQATLRVTSNDPDTPVVDVPILVQPVDGPVCKLQLVPSGVNFGAVTLGQSIDKTINLVSVGTGICTLVEASLVDCPVGGDGAVTCPEPFSSPSSTEFSLMTAPPATPIGPGSTTPLTVRLTPTTAGSDPATPLNVRGRLAVRYRDEGLGGTYVIPQGTGTPPVFPPNLQGSVVAP